MIFTANLGSISSAAQLLHSQSLTSAQASAVPPTLAGYSQIPSLQSVAMQHSNAINGATGSSTLVARALLRELEWAAVNLRSLENVVRRNELSLATLFKRIDPQHSAGNLATSFSEISGSFARRPPFQVGNFAFTPAAVTSEPATDVATLLSMFSATNDGLVASATAYWDSFAAQMTALSSEIMGVISQLRAANAGLVFESATATLTGFSARATQIAESATILSGHLKVLPSVKAMAVNALSSIQAQSAAIPDAAAKKAFEQSEVAAFMAGPYATELQEAVPTIPNLVSPDAGGGVSSVAMAGANVVGRGGTNQFGLEPIGMAGFTKPASAAVVTAASTPEHLTHMANAHAPASTAAATAATLPTSPQPMSSTNPASALMQPSSGGAHSGNYGSAFSPVTNANQATPPSPMMSAMTPKTQTTAAVPKAPSPMAASGSGAPSAGAPSGNAASTRGLSPVNGTTGGGDMRSPASGHTIATSSNTNSPVTRSIGNQGHGSAASGFAPRGANGGGNNYSRGASSAFGMRNLGSGTTGSLPGGGRYLGANGAGIGNGLQSGGHGISNGHGNSHGGSGSGSRSDGLRNTLLGKGPHLGAGGAGHGASSSLGANSGTGGATHSGAVVNRPGAQNPQTGTSGAGGRTGGLVGTGRKFAQNATNVSAIRRNHNDASQFEQNEYQLELFGEEPITVPSVIGSNVRG